MRGIFSCVAGRFAAKAIGVHSTDVLFDEFSSSLNIEAAQVMGVCLGTLVYAG